MSDLTEFTELNTGVRGGAVCQTGKALEALTPAARRKVLDALASPVVEGVAISRWLKKKKGLHVPASSVLRHRKRECACERSK